MNDLFAGIDANRLALAAFVVTAACLIVLSGAMAAGIYVLRGVRKTGSRQHRDPDPFFAPGSHQGLRVGPPTTRARSGRRTARPGTSQ